MPLSQHIVVTARSALSVYSDLGNLRRFMGSWAQTAGEEWRIGQVATPRRVDGAPFRANAVSLSPIREARSFGLCPCTVVVYQVRCREWQHASSLVASASRSNHRTRAAWRTSTRIRSPHFSKHAMWQATRQARRRPAKIPTQITSHTFHDDSVVNLTTHTSPCSPLHGRYSRRRRCRSSAA